MEGLARFRPGLEKALALAGGTHTVEDVVELVLAGKAQLWSDGEALIITEILQYPQKRVLRFWIATGELDACIRLHRQVLKWGAKKSCDLAYTTGRRGWTKALRTEGWTEQLVVLSQELYHG